MNVSLLLFGLAKALFGILVGAVAIYAASRVLHRLIRTASRGDGDEEQMSLERASAEGNVAVGVFKAGSLVALGILFQHSVNATFNAMDLMYRGREISWIAVRRFAIYAAMHLGVSMVISAAVLALGTLLFTRLTRNVDEMAEIWEGNVAPAVVLAAVMVVLALMTAPGLQTALDGMLPLPELGRDQAFAPA